MPDLWVAEAMTKDELWKLAVEYALSHYENRWVERLIREALDDCHGNVTLAMKTFTHRDESWHSSLAETVGNFGLHWNGVDVECYGSAISHPVEAWCGKKYAKNKVVVSWREIFEYVKRGGPAPKQLTLF